MKKPNPLRFKRKSYGRGRVPATRQGRAILVVYLILDIGRVVWYGKAAKLDQQLHNTNPDAGGNLFVLVFPIAITTILLLIICYRTGETPRWQWGEREKNTIS